MECFVFSSWSILFDLIFIFVLADKFVRYGPSFPGLGLDSLFILQPIVILAHLFNILIFYIVCVLLCSCINSNVLFYGAGFTQCCFLFIPSAIRLYYRITGFNPSGEVPYIIFFLIAVLAYYSYISVYYTTGEKINNISIGLILSTVFTLCALFILEIILQTTPVSWVAIIIYIAFIVCIIISDNIRLKLTPRRFGWCFFVLSYCLGIYDFLYYFRLRKNNTITDQR